MLKKLKIYLSNYRSQSMHISLISKVQYFFFDVIIFLIVPFEFRTIPCLSSALQVRNCQSKTDSWRLLKLVEDCDDDDDGIKSLEVRFVDVVRWWSPCGKIHSRVLVVVVLSRRNRRRVLAKSELAHNRKQERLSFFRLVQLWWLLHPHRLSSNHPIISVRVLHWNYFDCQPPQWRHPIVAVVDFFHSSWRVIFYTTAFSSWLISSMVWEFFALVNFCFYHYTFLNCRDCRLIHFRNRARG